MIDKSKPYRKCLVLDLDETLVHSSFKPVPDADFVVPVEIENIVHQVCVYLALNFYCPNPVMPT